MASGMVSAGQEGVREVSAGSQNKSLRLKVLDCPFSSSLLLAFLVNLVLLPSSASLISAFAAPGAVAEASV